MKRVHNKHHGTAPAGAVYIGRGSPYGNSFVIGKHGDRDEVCDKFEMKTLPNLDVSDLIGKEVVCFCKPQRCHGDAIMKKVIQIEVDRLSAARMDILCGTQSKELGGPIAPLCSPHAVAAYNGNEAAAETLAYSGFPDLTFKIEAGGQATASDRQGKILCEVTYPSNPARALLLALIDRMITVRKEHLSDA